jgi:hypothetical protein
MGIFSFFRKQLEKVIMDRKFLQMYLAFYRSILFGSG